MTRESSAFDLAYGEALDGLDPFGHPGGVGAVLKRLVDAYGLRNAAYLAVNLPKRGENAPYIVATYPEAWVQHYRAQSYHRHDPVILRGLDALLPLDWAALDRSAPRTKRLFGEAGDFGVGRHGLSFPIRGRSGERAIFSITADETDQGWRQIRRELVRDFQVIAFHVHRAVLAAETTATAPVRLSPREVQCLQWAAAGKTQPETAAILGLSERTIIYYLEIARHKLDAINTTHAVAKAMSMNIVTVGL